MKNKNSALQYQKMVLRKSKDETLSYYLDDKRNLIGNIVVALLSGTTSGIISYFQHNNTFAKIELRK